MLSILIQVAKESKSRGQIDFVWFENPVGSSGYNFFLSEGVVYNAYDAGNFVWRNALKQLGYSLPEAQIGAHVHNFFLDKGSRWHKDSKGDQQTIINGWKH